jgi:hypothetical protein
VLKLAADARPHALKSRKRGQFGELLHKDNQAFQLMRLARYNDVATASMIEVWIDQT